MRTAILTLAAALMTTSLFAQDSAQRDSVGLDRTASAQPQRGAQKLELKVFADSDGTPLGLDVSGGRPYEVLWLAFGLERVDARLHWGAQLLVRPDMVFVLGFYKADGTLRIDARTDGTPSPLLPIGSPAAVHFYAQAFAISTVVGVADMIRSSNAVPMAISPVAAQAGTM